MTARKIQPKPFSAFHRREAVFEWLYKHISTEHDFYLERPAPSLTTGSGIRTTQMVLAEMIVIHTALHGAIRYAAGEGHQELSKFLTSVDPPPEPLPPIKTTADGTQGMKRGVR